MEEVRRPLVWPDSYVPCQASGSLRRERTSSVRQTCVAEELSFTAPGRRLNRRWQIMPCDCAFFAKMIFLIPLISLQISLFSRFCKAISEQRLATLGPNLATHGISERRKAHNKPESFFFSFLLIFIFIFATFPASGSIFRTLIAFLLHSRCIKRCDVGAIFHRNYS